LINLRVATTRQSWCLSRVVTRDGKVVVDWMVKLAGYLAPATTQPPRQGNIAQVPIHQTATNNLGFHQVLMMTMLCT
jgi:hypothetical protein